MKKALKRIFASLLCACFCIAFSITAGAADALSDILASLDTVEKYDIIEYDYVTGNEQVISWESIPDYSKTVSSTFSLSNPATKAPEFHSYELSDSLPVLNQPVRTYLNGDPYSGVVYLALGVDTDFNGQTNRYGKATGFLVRPNVVVTAAHNILNKDTSIGTIVEVRVYSDCDDSTLPEDTSKNFVYPSKWWYTDSFQGYEHQTNAYDYDWAVILLQEDIDDTYLFNCSTVSDSASELSGYLEMIGYCGNQNAYQYGSTGFLQSLEQRHIVIGMPILPGHSGSPLTDKSSHICYGIATASSEDYMLNTCTRITPVVFDTICYAIENFA